ncbi:MAG: ABC transporter permease [Balneolales bacterium]|nr:ABC transporter permease [Balneolales bacterium]
MNIFKLSFSYLKKSPLNTGLNILLLALGIATITTLLLFNHQFRNNLVQNAEGIDLVVGAKGSPIQLILSSIYHIDSPTGNISLGEVQSIINNPMVAQAIPLALGDNYQGYRIVGTERSYLALYEANIEKGEFWKYSKEIVAGANVANKLQLSLGDTIVSSHGVMEAGQAHEDEPLIIVGILEETNSVLDQLLLTSVESVWDVHEHDEEHEEEHDDHDHEEGDEHDHDHDEHEEEHAKHKLEVSTEPFGFITNENLNKELTSLLIVYNSPLAGAMFPRFVNDQTDMQAAAPGFEITRLLSLLGIGFDVLEVFGFILILASMLGIFIALYNAMKERKYDLAVMRTLGGSRIVLMSQILLEGILLVLSGSLLGILFAHLGIAYLSGTYQQAEQFNINAWVILPEELIILNGAVILGILSALVPAIIAYRTPISTTLSKES